ncbi:MAG: copper amine oxidase N-terminal domain-containing protein, partial [Clostridia bacterium]|nr:copper amine oxidase N-terminal domain-containing protein [Clostridia bacterium]
MKKFTLFLAIAAIAIAMLGITAYAADDISVYVLGSKVQFDVQPEIANSRTMVPMRAIFEALGCDVQWDDASKTAVATKGSTTIKLTQGSNVMNVNSSNVLLDAAPYIKDSRVLVPVRAISESLECEVRWDGETRTVTVLKKLIDTTNVTFDGAIDGSPRIMIVGNSITRHAPSSSIGWSGNYGMAASSIENDYVHILMKRVRETHPNAVFCIVQAAGWERGYADENIFDGYSAAPDFAPDVVIYRLGENVKDDYFAANDLSAALPQFLRYLTSQSSDAEYIFTTNFWTNEAVDNVTRQTAAAYGKTAIELGMYGADNQYKAIGL